MSKIETYREQLRQMCDWDNFLLAESGLPGPRGNLELARAAADEGDAAQFRRWRRYDATIAPTNTPGEFLAFCGVLGLGRLLAEGDRGVLPELRRWANDSRWRTREAVAMALQRWGAADMAALLAEADAWAAGTRLEQRAIAAGLCEPALLADATAAGRVLDVLDRITATLDGADDRRTDGFAALRKGLGYCWSVAVAGSPAQGKALMARWLSSADPDILWVMRENLKKNRLVKMDAAWVAQWRAS